MANIPQFAPKRNSRRIHTCLLLWGLMMFSSNVLLRADPLLHYLLDEGQGRKLKDSGVYGLDLKSYSQDWAGPHDGPGSSCPALINTAPHLSSNSRAENLKIESDIAGLVSYTITLWVNMKKSQGDGGGRLLSMGDPGTGTCLYLALGDQTLLIHHMVDDINHLDSRTLPDSLVGKGWVFLAWSVDARKEKWDDALEVYMGTESERVCKVEPMKGRGNWRQGQPTGLALRAITQFILGNTIGAGESPQYNRAIADTWFSDCRIYGSSNDGSGALNKKEIDAVRTELLRGK